MNCKSNVVFRIFSLLWVMEWHTNRVIFLSGAYIHTFVFDLQIFNSLVLRLIKYDMLLRFAHSYNFVYFSFYFFLVSCLVTRSKLRKNVLSDEPIRMYVNAFTFPTNISIISTLLWLLHCSYVLCLCVLFAIYYFILFLIYLRFLVICNKRMWLPWFLHVCSVHCSLFPVIGS